MFVDKVHVSVKAGNGGNGVVSFRHEKFVDKGGPDGGDGGKGGDVVLVASRNQHTLAAFRYKKLLQAEHGQAGAKQKKHGKKGEDLTVMVPVGTVVTDLNGVVIADLPEENSSVVIAKGGDGGFGNAHFTSSTRQTPRVAEKGEQGESLELLFELKSIADVGLVGLPNAGKSTFLSVVSNAKPEIANYPFTTLSPNLGVVDVRDQALVMADIPGLIEGASEGKGLGDDFLRHVERTKVLLHLIDGYSESLAESYDTIQSELASYKVDLSKKPQIVAITKTEGMDNELIGDLKAQLQKHLPKKVQLFAVSSKSKQGLQDVLDALLKMVQKAEVDEAKQSNDEKSGLPVITLDTTQAWQVSVQNNEFTVKGSKIERFARRTDFDDFHSLQRLRDIMKKMGITHELHRKGVEAGSVIRISTIGSFEF